MKSNKRDSSSGIGGPGAIMSPGAGRRTTGSRTHKNSMFEGGGSGLVDDTAALHAKIAHIEDELKRRQENFISRERAFKLRIEELEDDLSKKREEKTGWMKSDPKIANLKSMQKQILSNVALVQDRFSRIMQEQEHDLLRAFKDRLLDVQSELEMEKSKKDDGAIAFIEKSKGLENEVEKQKEHADIKERQNQALLQANNRLKSQFLIEENDRNFLMTQLVAAQKDNASLRTEYSDLERQEEKLKYQLSEQEDRLNAASGMGSVSHAMALGSAAAAQSTAKDSGLLGSGLDKALGNAELLQQRIDNEERYKEVNARLRRLLAEERKSLQQVRQNYANELNARTEMEMILRQCVEQVKKEYAAKRDADAPYKSAPNNNRPSPHEHNNNKATGGLAASTRWVLQQEDEEEERRLRERVLELLLSKDEVVALIYTTNRSSSNSGAVITLPSQPPSQLPGTVTSMQLDSSAAIEADAFDPSGSAAASGSAGIDPVSMNGARRPLTAGAMSSGAGSGGTGGGGGSVAGGLGDAKLPSLSSASSRVSSR